MNEQFQQADSFFVGVPEVEDYPTYSESSANMIINQSTYRLWYRVQGSNITHLSDPFLPAALYLAMAAKFPLILGGELSPELLPSANLVQQIAEKWYKNFQSISVNSLFQSELKETGNHVGCFFSGGVDSFYSLLKNNDEVTHIIFVIGFDIDLENRTLSSKVVEEIETIAATTGKKIVYVETNIRKISDPIVDWTHYFGSALCSVALLLAPSFKKIFIPSSESFAHLEPCGSHPLLDPLWSAAGLKIVHDGCEASRIEKIKFISTCDTAMRKLRVCWENRDNAYNCGVCEKCLRTMINLYAVDSLEKCSAFAVPLDPLRISRMRINESLVFSHIEDNLAALRASDKRNSEVTKAIAQVVSQHKLQDMLKQSSSILVALKSTDSLKHLDLAVLGQVIELLWVKQKAWLLKIILFKTIKELDRKLLGGALARIRNSRKGV